MKKNYRRAVLSVLVGFAAIGVAAAQPAPSQRASAADVLLAVDQNRATVVDRIVTEWGTPLAQFAAGLSADQLRTMLGGLRADHLLAASLAGSLAGLRDVIANAVSVADGKSGSVQTKSVGDLADDVAYTPVTPCRLVETRTAFAAVYHAGGPFAPNEVRSYVVQGGNGVCLTQLPVNTGAAAVQLQVFGIPTSPASSGDIEILPQGAAFGNTATEVYVGNVLINTVSTVAAINTTNNQISVQVRGGGANLAIDVVGYFRQPTNYSGASTITGHAATVNGGDFNVAAGDLSTVGGGSVNTANGADATIGGGHGGAAAGEAAVVGGGWYNKAVTGYSTVAGGFANTASGLASAVPGGVSNVASGTGSFAAGQFAQANGNGCFVFGDASTSNDVECNNPNQFVVRSVGGVYFFSGGTSGATYSGVHLAAGAGAWSAFSDRNGKSNIRTVDAKAVLRKVAAMPIATWNWKTQDSEIRHMGPMAQDFHHTFGLGETPLAISTVDADGVALAAIQGLDQLMQTTTKGLRQSLRQRDQKLNRQEGEIKALQLELQVIKARLGIH